MSENFENGSLRKRRFPYFLFLSALTLLDFTLSASSGYARIYVDINAPSVRKFNIAIPDFKRLNTEETSSDLAVKLPAVISNDLDLSGYFSPMDKSAFLEEHGSALTLPDINFRDWSVIGAELLLKASFVCIGGSLEVEYRLFDVFWGKQILGRRVLGKTDEYRRLMHRIGNEIIKTLTDEDGIFLTKLAFVGNATGNKEIYTCDYDGHNVLQLTKDKSIALSPRWSPDGRRILFNSYKDGSPWLYMKDMSSGALERVSSRLGLNIGASWAPDGTQIALTLSHKGNPEIFSIDLSGKILKRLTSHWGIDVSAAFSPDGQKLAFVSNRSGSPQIYVTDLNRGTEQRLTFEGTYNTSPSWSKLNRIAFVSMNDGDFNICAMDPDGGRLRQLTDSQAQNEDPCWSPDGRYLVFSSNREGRYNLYLMNANGGNQRRITAMKGDQTAPSWGP